MAKRSKSGRVHQILAPAGRGDFKSVRSITRWGAFIGSGTPEGEANALLCTAAPDLAEAAKAVLKWADDLKPYAEDGSVLVPVFEALRAALAKAGAT